MATFADAQVEVTVQIERGINAKIRSAANAAGREFQRGLRDGMREGAGKAADDAVKQVDRRSKSGFVKSGANAGRGWGDAFRENMQNAVSRAGIGILQALPAALTKGTMFSAFGAAAASAAASLIQFAAAAAPAANVILALPAGIAVATAAVATLKVAFSGMGDAFKAALDQDPAKFAEALQKLSPAAQQVAKDFQGIVPQLNEVKRATQEAFFGPLQGQLQGIAANLAGPVKAGMSAVAAEAGKVAAGFAQMAQSSATASVISQVFDVTRQSVANLSPAIQAIATGLRDLIGAVVPVFAQLSGSLGQIGVQFGQWLSQVSASGQAFQWVQTALGVLRQLGDLAMQLGGILAQVFKAAQTTGGGLLGTLTELLRGVNAFLSSAQGMSILEGVFSTLNQVGAALGPVIQVLLTQLGGLFPIISQIVQALGPALQAALGGLGAALQGLGPGIVAVIQNLGQAVAVLAPALGPLGAALGQILAALAPLLPAIGQLAAVLAGVLAQAILALVPVITPLVDLLANYLGEIIPQLGPPLIELVKAFGELLAAVMPILDPILKLAIAFEKFYVAQVLVPMIQALAGVISFLAGIISGAVDAVSSFVNWLGDLGDTIGSGFSDAISAVGDFLSGIGDAFLELPGMILDGLLELPQMLWDFFTGALGFALEAIGAGIGLIILAITKLPGLIIDGLVALPGLIGNFFSSAFNWAVNAVSNAVSAIIGFVSSLPGRIGSFLAALPGIIGGAFASAFSAAVGWVTNLVNTVVSWINSIPGRIGAFAGAMFNAGKKLIDSLMNGLKAVGGFISDVGAAIVNGIRNAINWVIDRINSGIRSVWPGIFGGAPQIPRLAQGAIIERQTLAIIGEQGREVVIPLTKPDRAEKLAHESGLVELLARRGALGGGGGSGSSRTVHVNAPITVNSAAANPVFAARRTADHIAALAQA